MQAVASPPCVTCGIGSEEAAVRNAANAATSFSKLEIRASNSSARLFIASESLGWSPQRLPPVQLLQPPAVQPSAAHWESKLAIALATAHVLSGLPRWLEDKKACALYF